MNLRTDFDADKVRRVASGADKRRSHRLEAIARLYDGDSVDSVARIVAVEPLTIRRWVETFNEGGVAALMSPDLRTGQTFHLRSDFDARSVRELADRAGTIGARARFIAIALMYDGVTIADISKQLKIDRQRLVEWRDDFNRDNRLISNQSRSEAPRLEARNRRWPASRVAEFMARHPDMAERLRPILASINGSSVEHIAEASGHTRARISSWIRIFNASGAKALVDQGRRPSPSSSAPPKAPSVRGKVKPAKTAPARETKRWTIELPYDANALREAANIALTGARRRNLVAIAEAMDADDAKSVLARFELKTEYVKTLLTEIRQVGLARFARRELAEDVTADDLTALVPRFLAEGLPKLARELELMAMIYRGSTMQHIVAQEKINEQGMVKALATLKHVGLPAYIYQRAETIRKASKAETHGTPADASGVVATAEGALSPRPELSIRTEEVRDISTLISSTTEDVEVGALPDDPRATVASRPERGADTKTLTRVIGRGLSPRRDVSSYDGVDEPFARILDRAVQRTSRPPHRMTSWAEVSGRGEDLLRMDDDAAALMDMEVEMSVRAIRGILRAPIDPGLMSRMEAVQKVKSGTSIGRVARTSRIPASDVALWISALNRQGPAALMDDMSILAKYRPRLRPEEFETLKRKDPKLAHAVKSLAMGAYPPLVAQSLNGDLRTMMSKIEGYRTPRGRSSSACKASLGKRTKSTDDANVLSSPIIGTSIHGSSRRAAAVAGVQAHETSWRRADGDIASEFQALLPTAFQQFAINAIADVRTGWQSLASACERRGIPVNMMRRWVYADEVGGVAHVMQETRSEGTPLPRGFSASLLRDAMEGHDLETRSEMAALALLYDGARLEDAAEITGVDVAHLFNLVDQIRDEGMAVFEDRQDRYAAQI